MHVDPHITHYTVYITDNHTGGVVRVNVTETHFTYINRQGNIHCPMYQVSAWNAGGEGELSEPVQPHSKLHAFLCHILVKLLKCNGCFLTFVYSSSQDSNWES